MPTIQQLYDAILLLSKELDAINSKLDTLVNALAEDEEETARDLEGNLLPFNRDENQSL